MKRKRLCAVRSIGLFLVVCLLCSGISALAEPMCWYYEEYGMHDFEQVDARMPGCETEGYYVVECRQCGLSETYFEAAFGHSWELQATEAATCTYEGYEEYICTNCNDTRTEAIPKLQHDWVDGEVLEIATCTREGSVRTYCAHCHKSGTREIAKISHNYGNWSVSLPATDHSQGTRTKSCSACGNTVSESFYPDGTLYHGMNKNDSVVACQKILIELGYLKDKADGVFGKKTEQAVKDFQSSAGFAVSGVAYPQTLKALTERVAITASPTVTPQPTPTPMPTPTSTPEPSAQPTAEPAPDTCTRYVDEAGAERIAYCPYHAELIAKCEEKVNLAKSDADKLQVLEESSAEWQTELERLYDVWFESASAEDKPGIAQAKSMYLVNLKNQESMWTARNSGQPIIVKQHVIDALMEQCADLCALAADAAVPLRFSFSHSGMSMDTIYSYTVSWLDQGYLADYDLFGGRIEFSLSMDEEDVAALASLTKGLVAWNGFSETNPDILDGEAFDLRIEYADGAIVSASGSNAFPQGYAENAQSIVNYFLKLMEKHEIAINE